MLNISINSQNVLSYYFFFNRIFWKIYKIVNCHNVLIRENRTISKNVQALDSLAHKEICFYLCHILTSYGYFRENLNRIWEGQVILINCCLEKKNHLHFVFLTYGQCSSKLFAAGLVTIQLMPNDMQENYFVLHPHNATNEEQGRIPDGPLGVRYKVEVTSLQYKIRGQALSLP